MVWADHCPEGATESCVPECDREASKMGRAFPTGGCSALEKNSACNSKRPNIDGGPALSFI
jgi:hypothetical protein